MSGAEQRLKALGLALPAGSAPAANYANAVRTGNLLFIAGKAPLPENGKLPKGRLGREWRKLVAWWIAGDSQGGGRSGGGIIRG